MRKRAERSPGGDEVLLNVRIVLVRPRGSANVGAAARAMKNMGVGALTLVQPAVRSLKTAEAMAVHARDVVRSARVVGDIAEAVGDCALVIGTTCRGGPYRAGAEEAEALAPLVLATAVDAPVAVLFGPEDHGLTNDDLRYCQRLVTIDTSPAYASLNLAQTVLLVCYALRHAARRGHRFDPGVIAAPASAVQRMYVHLQRALLSIGFLHPQNPEHIMFALRRLFGRSGLADHEVRILLGIARQIEWFAGKTGKGVTADRLPVTGPDRAEQAERTGSIDQRSPATGHRSRLSAPDHG